MYSSIVPTALLDFCQYFGGFRVGGNLFFSLPLIKKTKLAQGHIHILTTGTGEGAIPQPFDKFRRFRIGARKTFPGSIVNLKI